MEVHEILFIAWVVVFAFWLAKQFAAHNNAPAPAPVGAMTRRSMRRRSMNAPALERAVAARPWLAWALCALAALLGLVAGFEAGVAMSGPLLGTVMALNAAVIAALPCSLVPREGLEPSRLAAADFESAASTGSAISARASGGLSAKRLG